MIYYKLSKSNQGVAALLTVIVIASAALIIALSASYLGLGELSGGYYFQKGEQVEVWTEGCANEVLQKIRENSEYGLNRCEKETILRNGSNYCIIYITGDKENRQIRAQGNIDNFYKTVEVDLSVIGNDITINSWKLISE